MLFFLTQVWYNKTILKMKVGFNFMLSREYTVASPDGIHARPASLLVSAASKFPDTSISLTVNGHDVNLKSIMGVMSLGIGQHTRIIISTSGDDEQAAMDSIQDVLIKNRII